MMLPVATVQVGWVTVIIGASGAPGTAIITTLVVGEDMQPWSLVTVKLYVPAASALMFVDRVLPEIEPGLTIQLPAGKPFNVTEPVDTVQSGCVTAPNKAVVGVKGCAFIVKDVIGERQLLIFFALTVCDPDASGIPPL
jgi:hypothetical protein